jgi:hypothetical protein
MKNISFKATKEETALALKIIDRARELLSPAGLTLDTVASLMDLQACHANGTPLDFEKFLAFDDANFGHDFMGIWRHMDRNTGTLKDFFVPRCAK